MTARFKIDIVGVKELRARFSPEHFRLAMVRALPEAFEPARVAIAAAAPRKSGKLARGIKVRVGQRGGSAFTVTITAAAGYGHLVEYGHRMVVGGKVSRARSLGGRLNAAMSGRFTGQVVGDVPAHPFARPAFEGQAAAVAHSLEVHLAEALGGP